MQTKSQVILDEYTDNVEEQCYYCKGKSICVTACCNKRICHFHRSRPDEMYECELCIETKDIEHNGRICYEQKNGLIYCEEHFENQLLYCEDCCCYYCQKHFDEDFTSGEKTRTTEKVMLDNKTYINKLICRHGWSQLQLVE